MFWICHIPQGMKQGVIVPIPKGRKASSDPNNNRKITLLSTKGKIYLRLVLKRNEDWFRDKLSNLQGTNKSGCFSLNTAFLLHEGIAQTTGGFVVLGCKESI